jgi:hypothetical protein
MPVKFGDIPKLANEVLNDDYQLKGYQLAAKQKTTWDGAVASTTVDILPGAKDATPAKLSWKFPKPFGVAGVSVDKLDFTKEGKYALEVTATKDSHKVNGLTIKATSDLATKDKATIGCTYTGIKDCQIILDTKATKPKDFTLEVTQAIKSMTVGVKMTQATLAAPDLGIRFTYAGIFGAVTCSLKNQTYSAFSMYKVSDAIKAAGTCTYSTGPKAKAPFTMGAGLVYDVRPGMKLKAKVEKAETPVVSVGLKYEISKGLTALFGGKFTFGKGVAPTDQTFGVKISVE